MKSLQEIFPPATDKEYSYSPWINMYDPEAPEGYEGPSYNSLVKAMDVEIVSYTFAGQYQGDAVFIVKENDKYGWLVFGYGSCSGCDALEGSNTYEELEELRQNLYNSIRWFDTKAALYDFLKGKLEVLSLSDDDLDTKKWSSDLDDWYWYDREVLDCIKEMVDKDNENL